MSHQFLMFLAPDNAATRGLTQATLRTPPAYPSQANASGPVAAPLQPGWVQPGSENHILPRTFSVLTRLARKWFSDPISAISAVVGNAIGLGGFIAGCWFCLQLLQTFL